MGITERRSRQKQEVRDSILKAAWLIVKEDGWQTLSIRKIADAIEYSVPVVYDHFENKEGILSEFTQLGYQLLSDDLIIAKTKHKKASRQLEAIAFAYWDFAINNKSYYQLMFGLGMPGCESIKSTPELMAFTEVIKSTIEECAKELGNKKIKSVLKLHVFWSTIHGLVSINSIESSASRMGLSPEHLNKMVLNDFIKSFIKGLEE